MVTVGSPVGLASARPAVCGELFARRVHRRASRAGAAGCRRARAEHTTRVGGFSGTLTVSLVEA